MTHKELAIKAAMWDWCYTPWTKFEEFTQREFDVIAETATDFLANNTLVSATDVVATLFPTQPVDL